MYFTDIQEHQGAAKDDMEVDLTADDYEDLARLYDDGASEAAEEAATQEDKYLEPLPESEAEPEKFKPKFDDNLDEYTSEELEELYDEIPSIEDGMLPQGYQTMEEYEAEIREFERDFDNI